MIANDFAEDRSEINSTLQIASRHAVHHTGRAVGPRNWIIGMASDESAGATSTAAAFHRSASDPHEPGFRVIGAIVAVLDRGAAELREGYNDEVLPTNFTGVVLEIFAQ